MRLFFQRTHISARLQFGAGGSAQHMQRHAQRSSVLAAFAGRLHLRESKYAGVTLLLSVSTIRRLLLQNMGTNDV